MSFNYLTSLSPLDGRYVAKVDALREQLSEFGLIRRRLQVEIEWLKALAAEPHFAEIPAFKERSWGMSHDYKIAIKHGSTMVRVGTNIFGPRVY